MLSLSARRSHASLNIDLKSGSRSLNHKSFEAFVNPCQNLTGMASIEAVNIQMGALSPGHRSTLSSSTTQTGSTGNGIVSPISQGLTTTQRPPQHSSQPHSINAANHAQQSKSHYIPRQRRVTSLEYHGLKRRNLKRDVG